MKLAVIIAIFFVVTSTSVAVNIVKKPIFNGARRLETKFFAQIPNFEGLPSKIVGIVSQGSDLYVTTSSSGGLIYKIQRNGNINLWFNAAAVIKQRTGRNMNFANAQHGGKLERYF